MAANQEVCLAPMAWFILELETMSSLKVEQRTAVKAFLDRKDVSQSSKDWRL